MRKWLLFGCLFLSLGASKLEAKPRFPFPSSADQVGQNDRDLDDRLLKLIKKTNVIFVSTDSKIVCLSSPAVCVYVSSGLVSFIDNVNISSAITASSGTISGQFIVNGNMGLGISPSFAIDLERSLPSGLDVYVKNTNAGSGAYTGLNLVNGGASAGNIYIYMSDGTNSYITGVDKSDSNKFKISKYPFSSKDFVVLNPTANSASIHGTETNDNAPTGFVGEATPSTSCFNAGFPPTSLTYGDALSITLTAGDWDVTGEMEASLNGATCTVWELAISATAGNSITGMIYGVNRFDLAAPTAAADNNIVIANLRVSINTTTTYYLKVRDTCSAGALAAYGNFDARRAR